MPAQSVGADDIIWLYVLVMASASVQQFFDPANDSVMPEIASDEELGAANSLMAIAQFGSTAIGFALAGLITAQFSVAWAFWSHKVLRWFAPLFLLTALATNIVLLSQPGFGGWLVLQAVCYGAACIGAFVPARGRTSKVLRLTTMFVSMNAALLVGLWRWMRGSQSGAWKRTLRAAEQEGHRSSP